MKCVPFFFQTIFQIRNVVFDGLPHVKMPFCLPLEWGGHLLGSDLLTSPAEGGHDDDDDDDGDDDDNDEDDEDVDGKLSTLLDGDDD